MFDPAIDFDIVLIPSSYNEGRPGSSTRRVSGLDLVEGGNSPNGPLAGRRSTPHPSKGSAYAPPTEGKPRRAPTGTLTPPSSRGKDYQSDEDDSDAADHSGYDSDGNHVQYATKSNRTKASDGAWAASDWKSDAKPRHVQTFAGSSSKKPVSRSSTFDNSYNNEEYATDSDRSEAEFDDYKNAAGDREQSATGNNSIRTHDEESQRRREKAERKAARAAKRAEKEARKAREGGHEKEILVSDPEDPAVEPKMRRRKTKNGDFVDESTGDNRIRTHWKQESGSAPRNKVDEDEYVSDPERKAKYSFVKRATKDGYVEEADGSDNDIRTHSKAYSKSDFNPTASRNLVPVRH